jgi:hypothetical protein
MPEATLQKEPTEEHHGQCEAEETTGQECEHDPAATQEQRTLPCITAIKKGRMEAAAATAASPKSKAAKGTQRKHTATSHRQHVTKLMEPQSQTSQ